MKRGTKPVRWSATEWSAVEEPRTACKHGEYACARCGTSDRRDTMHTTRGGRGVVGAAIDRERAKR